MFGFVLSVEEAQKDLGVRSNFDILAEGVLAELVFIKNP